MFLSGADLAALRQAQSMAVETLLDRLRPSLAILGDPRRPTGTAALLDAQQGLFVAHRDAIQGSTVQARLGEGIFRLKVLARDTRSDLVLLGQPSSAPRFAGANILVADVEPATGTKIFVILAEGGFVGSFAGSQKLSLKGEPKQAVPNSELRFETPQRLVGGALVFSFDGRLVGTMGSTVARAGNAAPVGIKTLQDIRDAVDQSQKTRSARANFYPGGLTIAYTPSVSVVRRAVSGFMRGDHQAEYAALGIQVADAPGAGAGAVVMWVMPNSPAARSGVRVGDVLLGIGDRAIGRQYDFVQALFAFKPGDKTTLRLRHDGVERQVEVTLARSKA